MSLIQQSFVQSLLTDCDQLVERQQRQAKQIVIKKIDQIYQLFRRNIRDAFLNYSLDVIIRFTEIAVQIPQRFSKAAEIINLFFERVQTTNQFYIRALFVKAKVIAYMAHSNSEKGEQMLGSLKQSISFITKALDLIAPQQDNVPKGKDPKGAVAGEASNKSKYAFLIYNASTTLYKVTRFMLRPGWQKFFVDVYERIYKLLEEVDEADHNWRSRFAMILYQCLYDSERKPDAYKVLDTLWDKTKNKPCEFQDSLFRLRVYLCKENNALVANIKKDIEGADPNGWKVLQALQRMRSGLVPQAQIEKELMTIVNQISLGVLSTSQNNNSTQLSAVMQERLAEAGRIALKFNLTNLGSSIVSFLGKTRQPSQKALVLNEYNKAELLIKKKGDYVDKKTGMSMNALQIKQVEIGNRKEALKIMQKVMLINKKLDNAELIYEGSILVWNIALPFLSEQYHTFAARALDLSLSLLEQIDSNDHQLRTKFHLELINIYFENDLMFAQVENNVFKALRLDPSIPTNKLAIKPQFQEEHSLYSRPYHRYLYDFRQKVLLKNMQIPNPTPLDTVTQDLWTIYDHKSETTKIDTLQKCLKTLISYEEPSFKVDPQEMLVDEEIKKRKLDYDREKLRSFKRRKLLASEIARLSFEWDLNDFAKKASQFVLSDNWDVKNSIQLIISQGHCCLYMTQIKIDELYQQSFEPLFEEETGIELTEAKSKEIKDRKSEVNAFLKKNLEFALTAQQNYLIFNGAICLWNNFLHIFRVTTNDNKLRADLVPLLKDYFESMRNSLKEIQTKSIVYYDLDDKIQVFSNIGLIYARLLESQKQTALVEKVCEDLLLTNLSPNTRKLINGIKARVAGGKAATGGKPADPKKGGAPPPQKAPGFNDTFILEISNQLQLIQNSPNKADCENQIVKCFEGLDSWKPNQQDEIQLELHAELWVKLARLASNEENSKMLKYALRCSEKALAQSKVGEASNIPSNRLRWYSLAEFLSSQSLLKLVNPKTQQAASVEGLLLLSLARGVQAANKGFKCGINILVLDAGKQVWNVCARLQESKANRSKLIQPIRTVLNFIKQLKEDSESDLLLLLSQLYFRATWENNYFKEGEQVADMMLDLLPKNLQKSIWEAKMAFMSKQGKNELQAISSIKQAQPSLQAKLWVKLARIAPNPSKQHAAYNKALQILKKEHSVEIVQVLIEYSEWQLRVGKEPVDTVVKNLQYASNILIEIEIDPENDDEDGQGEDEGMTVNSHSKSRSMKSKKSYASKSIKSSQKDIKSKADKKPNTSNRSKASGISRMNRSGRAAKSVKNKNTKSVFSQREEDPNPQSLNCLHFERLFRIYTILATIHTNRSKKVTFALKASKSAIKMLEKSINTFNELQENAAKLNEKEEKITYKTITVPQSIQEWINYELPKEYLEKISKVQNMNFLGTYTLQKPELTYNYLCKLIDIISDVGLDYQTIPLRFLSKYITKHILENTNYYLLEELKLKRVFMNNRHPMESSIKIDFQNIKITEEEIKEELLKAQYQKINLTDSNNSFDIVSAPNLIQPLSKSNCWFELGKILIDFGEISTAKTHLKQALACAKILSNNEQIGKIHSYLSQISYLQGQMQEAVQHLLLAHRLCKSTSNWQKIIILAEKNLIGIKKYDILKNLLSKIQVTVGELIEESSKEGKERAGFRTEINQMKQLLVSADISMVYLTFRETIDQNTMENKNAFSRALENFQKSFDDKNSMWNLPNYEFFISNFQEIVSLYESRGGNELINLGSDNFNRIFNILTHLERNIKDFIKAVNLNDNEGGSYNSIVEIQIKIGFLCASALCQNYKQSVIENSIDQIEVSSNVGNQQVELFMKTLDREIKVKAQPVSTKLNQLELALTLLNDLEAHISETSIYYPRLLALHAYVQTLSDHSSSESLEAADHFKTKGETQLEKYQLDSQCFAYQHKVFEAISQQQIQHFPADYFEYIAKSQHAASIVSTLKFLDKKLNPNHKFSASQRLILTTKNRQMQQTLIQREKLYSNITKFPSFQDGLKLMPKNSAYIILKLTSCKTKLYFACIINQPETNNKKIISKSNALTFSDLTKIRNLNEVLIQCKKSLVKTPIDDENKLKNILELNEQKLKDVKAQLEALNAWWLNDLLEYLKTPRNVAQPVVGDKDKKGGKDQKKKGGKDQIAGYESPLPPSPSGIQSAVFLLDEFIYSLPFQELLPTDLIASVSKDSSFFWLSRKLQEIGFQSELNNSNGFGVDKGKYFGYDFKSADKNFKAIAAELAKGPQALKMQGIDTSTRLPSLGDFARVMGQQGYISVYGSIDLINHIKFNSFIEQVGSNKFRLLIINDNLNLFKNLLNKFKDLNTDNLSINLEESEKACSIIANLLNITVIKNRWVSQWHNLQANVKSLFKSLASGIYIGASNRQNRSESSLINHWHSYIHGPPIIRL